MKITEPMTMLTDYAITIETFVITAIVLISSPTLKQVFWAVSMFFLGISSLGGGTSHGFKDNFSENVNQTLWRGSISFIGLADLFMVLGSTTGIAFSLVIQIVIGFQTVLMVFWINFRDDRFIVVIVNYVPVMLLVIIVESINFTTNSVYSLNIILGIIISFLAAGIQISLNGRMPKQFNHNDLFHVIQMIGIYFFYLGIIQL